MVEASIQDGDLVIEVRGWSRLWTLKRQLRFPLSCITAVRWDPAVVKGWWKGWRILGTHLPGVIIAGTFYRDGGRHFWDVRPGASRAVTIELAHCRYRRLIVDVADPARTVSAIIAAVAKPPERAH